jgi:hypothetical protein
VNAKKTARATVGPHLVVAGLDVVHVGTYPVKC